MDCVLPDDFELIVIGTGMIESIVAAAASRIGKKVLHIDSNDFYGGMWASFNLEGLEKYVIKPQVSSNETLDNISNFLKTSEQVLNVGNSLFGIKDAVHDWHVPKQIINEIKSDSNVIVSDNTNKESKSIEEIKSESSEITQESILKQSRRFNLDLAPKLQFARGDFVELLISSNIARYSEYRSVSRVLTWVNGQLEVVPCSRSDVFSNTRVTVVEKRMLMKLLTTCMDEDDSHFIDYQNKTFYQYLKDRKLTQNLIHYVLYAISTSDRDTLCLQGVASTKRFLNSLGKFGKTPFLFSMYGSGELPQAFCRLCAVFGGTYCLNRPINSFILDETNKFTGLICNKQRISAQNAVVSIDKIPEKFATVWKKQYISRAIFVIDKSLLPCEKENLTLLLFPPEKDKNSITVIELGPATGTCPQNFYVIHMYCKQLSNPKVDFENCVSCLLNVNQENSETEGPDLNLPKPKVLWSLYFTLVDTENCDNLQGLPENIYPCAGPDLDLDYDESVKKAKEIFIKIFPDSEFLPRAPDPEEIIICDDEEQDSDNKTVDNVMETEEHELETNASNSKMNYTNLTESKTEKAELKTKETKESKSKMNDTDATVTEKKELKSNEMKSSTEVTETEKEELKIKEPKTKMNDTDATVTEKKELKTNELKSGTEVTETEKEELRTKESNSKTKEPISKMKNTDVTVTEKKELKTNELKSGTEVTETEKEELRTKEPNSKTKEPISKMKNTDVTVPEKKELKTNELKSGTEVTETEKVELKPNQSISKMNDAVAEKKELKNNEL